MPRPVVRRRARPAALGRRHFHLHQFADPGRRPRLCREREGRFLRRGRQHRQRSLENEARHRGAQFLPDVRRRQTLRAMLDDPDVKTAGRRRRHEGRALHHQAHRQGRRDPRPRAAGWPLLRHAHRLQRQALHPDDAPSLLLRQGGQQSRPRRRRPRRRNGPRAGPATQLADHPVGSPHAARPDRVVPRALARRQRLHRRRTSRTCRTVKWASFIPADGAR